MTEHDHIPTILDAGFDYLTMSVTTRNPDHKNFSHIARRWFCEKEEFGHEIKEGRTKGYDGLKCGGTFFGVRDDGCIWETSGGLSNEVAAYVNAHDLNPKITRADLQVTYIAGEVAENWATRKLRDADARAAEKRRKAARTVGSFKSDGNDTGFTVGRRGGNSYYRCYLAGIQHKDRYPPHSIRDECEFREQRAIEMWERWKASPDYCTLARNVVRSHMEKLNMFSPWHLSADVVEFPPIRIEHSDEKSLRWIQNDVAPVIARVGSGQYRDELIACLLNALGARPELVRTSERLASDFDKRERRKSHGD